MKTPYFPENPNLRQSKLRQIFEKAPKGAINLALGQPGEDTPAFIREAAAKVILDKPLGYTLNAGILPLREKLAEEYASMGVTPDRICITAGVQEALYALFYVLLDDLTEILLPDPGFLTYPSLTSLNDCSPRYYNLYPEDNFRFRAESVIESVTERSSAVLLAHPSNPTGSIATREELRKLVDFAANRPEGPLWLISDEVYAGMSYIQNASLAEFMDEYPYIVVMRGASKSHHMTGWRLGWTILPELLAKQYVATHQYITTCVSTVTQETFNAIRGTNEERDWLTYQNQLYKSKRDLVHRYLSGKREMYGGEGAFYWVMKLTENDLLGGNDEDWVYRMMYDHLVMMAPGSAFGQQTNGYARISYGPVMSQLEEGLKILAGVLK
jgi:aspartate/methionine/tyrosine aminotransferase